MKELFDNFESYELGVRPYPFLYFGDGVVVDSLAFSGSKSLAAVTGAGFLFPTEDLDPDFASAEAWVYLDGVTGGTPDLVVLDQLLGPTSAVGIGFADVAPGSPEADTMEAESGIRARHVFAVTSTAFDPENVFEGDAIPAPDWYRFRIENGSGSARCTVADQAGLLFLDVTLPFAPTGQMKLVLNTVTGSAFDDLRIGGVPVIEAKRDTVRRRFARF